MLAVITGYRVRLSVNSSVFPIVVKSQPLTVPEYGISIEPKTFFRKHYQYPFNVMHRRCFKFIALG